MVHVDLLIINANVLTLNQNNQKAGSVAVSNGRIVGIWKTSEPPRDAVSVTQETEVINLKGNTLIPGFIETHNHILGYAQSRKLIDCSSPLNQNISDIIFRIQEKVNQTPKGEWITGQGYDDTLLTEGRHPTRDDLDFAAPEHPVIIQHTSGHLSVANSMALKIAGIKKGISDPQGGHYGRDNSGQLNGVIYERPAMAPLMAVTPIPNEDELIHELGEAANEYIAQGITTNTDAAVGGILGDDLKVHLKAAEKGINPMHAQLMILHNLLREDGMFSGYTADQLDHELRERSNNRARLDSIKMFQDGSIQGLTAALRKPYFCDESKDGDLYQNQDEFNKEISDLHKRGFRVAVHGNGDRAIGSILEAYERALVETPRVDHRHRIEHVQTATLDDLDKMKKHNIAGSFFINHVYYWGDRHKRLFLGPERAERISPLADAVDRDLLFTLHSDCPITPISPLFLIWAAVNRITREGNILGSKQCIDVFTALKSMTIEGAKLSFDEEDSGSIEIGKRADFAVLDADPTMVDPREIKDISVCLTLIDGNVVYVKQGVSI
ncbi:putative amidohydrolase YtcJ [Virgibacillus halotolerans]|uniref:amidohydrolase n=1 Tax=Virgibacillus halotolerans TaxID=1071053 RepID=UPI0019603A34|nr:amidohydrolase [Virgibacillus halotolerans]MBM7599961.1 putative amidohydrolase YtcJ [Virgibacillus halotolerans]